MLLQDRNKPHPIPGSLRSWKSKTLRERWHASVLNIRKTSVAHATDGESQLAENQIIRWRYRIPDLTDDESSERIVTAFEVQEQLNGFKGATRRKIDDVRQAIVVLEDRVNILRRARNETWELIKDRLTSELDRTATSLSDRLTRLERMMQSQSASPAVASDPHQVDQEAFAALV